MSRSDIIETTLLADAVLFDTDGTPTDSIAAVEAARAKVALDIGKDPADVLSATHGKRATDILAQFKPHIAAHEMDAEVQAFEESILFFADAYAKHGPGSRSRSISPVESSRCSSSESDLGDRLASPVRPRSVVIEEIEDTDVPVVEWRTELAKKRHMFKAWQMEAAAVDRSVRILPGVKRLMDSIPEGRYAVATSGAKTYAYGCMTRVGIVPPAVTITADDKRLKAGKPAPDPLLLAAKELGYGATWCIVFEEPPSGICAGVASGATVIALCTSHARSKIEHCGAHFIVDAMEDVRVVVEGERLKFVVAERIRSRAA